MTVNARGVTGSVWGLGVSGPGRVGDAWAVSGSREGAAESGQGAGSRWLGAAAKVVEDEP